MDAGADKISVQLKDAGRTLIQVTDNGKGMSPTDARMSFERHATSKIRDAADLFAIRTMGFRGEALASICAIAHVEMKTRRADVSLGTHIADPGKRLQHIVDRAKATSDFVGVQYYTRATVQQLLSGNPLAFPRWVRRR